MGFFNFIETFFFISLGITFILMILLIYHFKHRLFSLEKKSDTMFEIINNVVKELTNIKKIVIMYETNLMESMEREDNSHHIRATHKNKSDPEPFYVNSHLPSQATANGDFRDSMESSVEEDPFSVDCKGKSLRSDENFNFSTLHSEKSIFGSGDASAKNVKSSGKNEVYINDENENSETDDNDFDSQEDDDNSEYEEENDDDDDNNEDVVLEEDEDDDEDLDEEKNLNLSTFSSNLSSTSLPQNSFLSTLSSGENVNDLHSQDTENWSSPILCSDELFNNDKEPEEVEFFIGEPKTVIDLKVSLEENIEEENKLLINSSEKSVENFVLHLPATKNESSSTLRTDEFLKSNNISNEFLSESKSSETDLENVNFASTSFPQNWSSSTLRPEESLNFSTFQYEESINTIDDNQSTDDYYENEGERKKNERESYKKMNIQQLRSLVISKGLVNDTSGMRKNDLVKLLYNFTETAVEN